jgi:hypothetical protein
MTIAAFADVRYDPINENGSYALHAAAILILHGKMNHCAQRRT